MPAWGHPGRWTATLVLLGFVAGSCGTIANTQQPACPEHNCKAIEAQFETALKTLRAKGDLSTASAAVVLGKLYEYGIGVEQSDSKAIALLKFASAAGESNASVQLGELYERSGADGAKRAAVWYEVAAKQGSVEAALRLAQICSSEGPANFGNCDARHWFEAAAAGHNPEAAEWLGDYYSSKNGGPDLPLAAEWYQLAARLGSAKSAEKLGELYVSGKGIGVDLAAAVPLLEQAARAGNAAAFYQLGVIAETNGPSGDSAAYTLFSVGAALGDEKCARQGAKLSATLSPAEIRAAQAVVASIWPALQK